MATLGHLPRFCPLPSPCAPQPLAGRAGREAEMSLALCSAAQQQLKHCCLINSVFLLQPKYSIIPDTAVQIISVPAETRTELQEELGKPPVAHSLLLCKWQRWPQGLWDGGSSWPWWSRSCGLRHADKSSLLHAGRTEAKKKGQFYNEKCEVSPATCRVDPPLLLLQAPEHRRLNKEGNKRNSVL